MLELIPKAHAQFFSADCSASYGTTGTGTSRFFTGLCPITGNANLSQIFDQIISLILFVAGALAVIYLLWSGISYITAGGDDAKAGTARKGIINAIIGIIIIVLAFVIEKTAARLFM
jgi:hypothetical protein